MIDHEDALRRVATGDEEALREIFVAEAATMIGVAARMLRRRELAEEVVQESFVQIWTKAGQYGRVQGSARGWIYAIVRNRALNTLRDGARELTMSPQDMDEAREVAEIDDAFERLGEASRLRGCLEQLDLVKRRAVLLAYVMGCTHGEIAAKLRAPLGTAKAWVRRGLISLKECLS